MNCKNMRELITPGLDNELDPPAAAALAEHLDTCADCCALHGQQARVQAAVRDSATYHRADQDLRAQIAAALPPPQSATPRAAIWRFGWRFLNGGGVLAALCAMIVLVVLAPFPPSSDERLAEEVVSSHARALLTDHVIDVASADQHTVKPWFNRKIDFSPPVRDLTDAGFTLIGGRLDYIDHHEVAVIVYRRRQHLIDLFIWPAGESERTGIESRSLRGYHVIAKTTAGMAIRAVSDIDVVELRQFIDLL